MTIRNTATAVFFVAFLVGFPHLIHAQTALTPEQKAALQAELQEVEAQAKEAQDQLAQAKNQSASLQRDINVLTARIKAAQLDIKAKNLLIQTLGNDIQTKEKHIDALEVRIAKGKETLASLLRKTHEMDSYSLPEVALSQSTVSGFFKDVDTFGALNNGLQDTFQRLRTDEAETATARDALDRRRDTEMDARQEIQREEANIKNDEAEKKRLLGLSKSSEKAYTGVVAEKNARAAQIRAQLFALRDSAAIPFGKALEYAQAASQKTGVSPAFILAILKQESNLGGNVGTCYLTDTTTGAGINSRTSSSVNKVMSPTRDVPPFIKITEALGAEYSKTVVSCPQAVGWGGAMGPAQFIASTWMLIKDRIAAELGISGMPDPWNPAHAIMASATYLGDLGADSNSYSAQRNAACKYYSGRACGLVTGNTAYGNNVMALADNIQRTMINPLLGL